MSSIELNTVAKDTNAKTEEFKKLLAQADTPDKLIAIAAMLGAFLEQNRPKDADDIVATFGNYSAADYTAAVDLFTQEIIDPADQRPEVVQTARASIDFIKRRFLHKEVRA